MTFEAAVGANPELAGAYRRGLQGLREGDRNKIAAATPRRLRGSIDLDAALAPRYPNDPRWDYGVAAAMTEGERVFWIEVHPASEGEIGAVLDKFNWLKGWLRTSASELGSLPKEFLWVSSGRSALTQRSPKLRQLALQGVAFKGGHFRIP